MQFSFCKLNSILETNEFNFRNNIKEEEIMKDKFPCPKCGSYDIEISYATISGLDMPTAVYGFTKYDYTCHKCGDSGYQWVFLFSDIAILLAKL